MKKINFENLPSTNTPISAGNLNEMQSNIEESAVIISPTEPTTNEKVWIQKGKNWFDGKLMIGGIDTGKAGIDLDVTGAIRSNYIKVNPNKIYTLSSVDSHNNYVVFYDKNYNFIDYYAKSSSVNTFTTPSNCYYIRFATYIAGNVTDTSAKFQLEQGATATSYEAYVEPKIYTKNVDGNYEAFMEEDVSISSYEPSYNRGKVWLQKGNNLYNPSKYPLSQGLWTEGEKIGFNDSGWYVVVPITGGLPYTISKTNNMIYCCTTASYPKGGVVQVDTWTGSGNVNQFVKETSPEAKYLFIGLLASSSATGTDKANAIAGLQVEQGRVATSYKAYVEPKIYVKNDNGVYEEFYKETNKNIITCRCSEDTSAVAEIATSVPIIKTAQIGGKFTIVDNAIRVGKGINYVKVSANFTCKSSIANVRAGIQPRLNGEYISSNTFNCVNANTYYGMGMASTLVSVKEGDLIDLCVYMNNGVTINSARTNITVEAIG